MDAPIIRLQYEIEALRDDLKEVAVAAQAVQKKLELKGGLWDVLREALARPGVKELLGEKNE